MDTGSDGSSTNDPAGTSEGLEGLEALGRLDQVLVKQRIEIAEMAFGIERRNRYRIMDANEQILYYAVEDTNLWNRFCFGPCRSFKLPIFTEDRTQVLLLSRPLACSCCLCFCCLQILTVSLLSGTVLGYVKQICDPLRPHYHVQNANREVIFKITGPIITCRRCGDVIFPVLNLNEEEVGVISKKWGGVAREYITDADYFSISYSENFDTKTKAILLGALFLIEYYTRPADVPPGLEELTSLEQVIIKQRISIVELAWGFERKNKYVIMDENEHILYDALEDTTLKNRLLCPTNRPFVIPIFDPNRVPVFILSRPWRCCCTSCACWWCMQILTVALPTGTVLGYVKQKCEWIRPRFEIQNGTGDPYLKIWGPYCLSRCRGDVNFNVFNLQEDEVVAVISKKWGGFAREAATDADFFTVTFINNMNITSKAIVIGAAILFDYLFFEKSKQPGTGIGAGGLGA